MFKYVIEYGYNLSYRHISSQVNDIIIENIIEDQESWFVKKYAKFLNKKSKKAIYLIIRHNIFVNFTITNSISNHDLDKYIEIICQNCNLHAFKILEHQIYMNDFVDNNVMNLACEYNNIIMVKYLHENYKLKPSKNTCHNICIHGHLDIIKYIVEVMKIDHNYFNKSIIFILYDQENINLLKYIHQHIFTNKKDYIKENININNDRVINFLLNDVKLTYEDIGLQTQHKKNNCYKYCLLM